MFICLTVCSRRYGFESHRPVQKQLLVMEQFNLDEYLQNPSRPVVTRDGRPVRIICTDANREETPVVALVKDKGTGYEALFPFSKRGKYYACSQESDTDLFFAPVVKHEGWVNIFSHNGMKFIGSIYPTLEEAKTSRDYFNKAFIEDTIKIEWEE